MFLEISHVACVITWIIHPEKLNVYKKPTMNFYGFIAILLL